MGVPAEFYRQSGVIAYQRREGSLEILLITSLRRRRWIIPKGVVEPELRPGESAAKEAYEEAGVRGMLSTEPAGEYRYEKWGGLCTVQVYLLEVRELLERWPEQGQRERRWLPVAEAAAAVAEPELQLLIARLPQLIT